MGAHLLCFGLLLVANGQRWAVGTSPMAKIAFLRYFGPQEAQTDCNRNSELSSIIKPRPLGKIRHAKIYQESQHSRKRNLLHLGGLLFTQGVLSSIQPRSASAEQVEEPTYYEFDSGHLALLLPPGYSEEADAPEDKKVLPGYLMTPDAVAQRENAKKSFSRLRNDRTDSSIIFSTVPASSFKITFTRVNDISDYGTIQEVGKRILPPGAQKLQLSVREETFPEKKTARGIVTPPPRKYYRYDFVTGDGQDHIAINLAVVNGFVYTMTVTCPQKSWVGSQETEILASMETMSVA